PSAHLHSLPTRRSSDLAADPFSKDALSIPSLDEDTAIYAGTWVADSEEQAFLLLGNENVMWLAVATQMEDGAYQLIAQSKPVLSDRKSTRLNSSHVSIS